VLEECIGGSWNTVEDCDDQTPKAMCSDRIGSCVVDLPGRYYCDRAQNALMAVQASGSAYTVNFCNDDERCDEYVAGCVPLLCVPGSQVCRGDEYVECDEFGNSFENIETCASAAMCADGVGCLEPIALAAGEAHTCAILAPVGSAAGTAGTVMCWGANDEGQLGTGTTLLGDTITPTRTTLGLGQFDNGINGIVYPGFTDICAGRDFTCALLQDFETGTDQFAACWGSNSFGQLGFDDASAGPFNGISFGVSDGTRDPDDNEVVEMTGVEQIACGGNFACLLDSGGSAHCWGGNDKGQLGIGSDELEMRVATRIDDHSFVQIAAGAQHACGVKDDGSLWCWGNGMRGQLGGGNEDDANEPVEVPGLTVQTALPPRLGLDFSVAASEGVPFRSFGGNVLGQLGDGSRSNSNEPVTVEMLQVDTVSQISLGPIAQHSCALQGGELYCWGSNVLGQLGTRDLLDRNEPVVSEMDGSELKLSVASFPKSVAAGAGHTCAIAGNHQVYCWGHNGRRQLGNGMATLAQWSPIAVSFP
jgi:alpha-tubulin suppressor-like RCC1 family protein